MTTIHSNRMISGTHDLTADQMNRVASMLRDNDCPYEIRCDEPGTHAAPTVIVVLQQWAPIVGQVLSRVLDPDKPVPPATIHALWPEQADNGETIGVTLPDPVGDVAAAA